MHTKRAQAAIEFLTTYAWAFLVIMIAVGAIYYFGIFDFAKFAPQQCIFSSQFECVDFALSGDEVRVLLLNNIGEDIRVEALNITSDDETALTCASMPAAFDWDSGTEVNLVFDGCIGGNFLQGERTESTITLIFYAPATPSQPRHQIHGEIHATVI